MPADWVCRRKPFAKGCTAWDGNRLRNRLCPLEPPVADEASAAAQVTDNGRGMSDPGAVGTIALPPLRNEGEGSAFEPASLDRDPLDRSTDRALAALAHG